MGCRTAPETIPKTPAEVVKKDFLFPAEDFATGEIISSVVGVTYSPAGELGNSASAISGQRVQLTLTGGVADTTYTITVKVSTSLGQTLEVAGKMEVCNP